MQTSSGGACPRIAGRWATLLVVLSITSVPMVQVRLSTTGLTVGKWGTVIVAAVLGTCWIEVAKRIGLAVPWLYAVGMTRLRLMWPPVDDRARHPS